MCIAEKYDNLLKNNVLNSYYSKYSIRIPTYKEIRNLVRTQRDGFIALPRHVGKTTAIIDVMREFPNPVYLAATPARADYARNFYFNRHIDAQYHDGVSVYFYSSVEPALRGLNASIFVDDYFERSNRDIEILNSCRTVICRIGTPVRG